jgi:hypothetical protein
LAHEPLDSRGRLELARLLFITGRVTLRYSTALAHAQLKHYDRAVAILRDLLRVQMETIGGYHPDAMRTQLDLSAALAMSGRKAEGEELVAVAEKRIREELHWRTDLLRRVMVISMLFALPMGAWSLEGLADRVWSP